MNIGIVYTAIPATAGGQLSFPPQWGGAAIWLSAENSWQPPERANWHTLPPAPAVCQLLASKIPPAAGTPGKQLIC